MAAEVLSIILVHQYPNRKESESDTKVMVDKTWFSSWGWAHHRLKTHRTSVSKKEGRQTPVG